MEHTFLQLCSVVWCDMVRYGNVDIFVITPQTEAQDFKTFDLLLHGGG